MTQQNNQNMKKGMFPYFLLLIIGLSIMFTYSLTNNTTKELSYNEFNKALAKDNVKFIFSPNFNFFNPFMKLSFPICNVACAKYILSECIIAFFKFLGPLYAVSVVISNSPQPSFFQLNPLYLKVSSAFNEFVVNPIAPVTGLNVEPGHQVCKYITIIGLL